MPNPLRFNKNFQCNLKNVSTKTPYELRKYCSKLVMLPDLLHMCNRSPKEDVVKFPSTPLYCKSILAGNPKSTECLDLMRKEILEKWEKSCNINTSKH